MTRIELWFWLVPDERTGRARKTRYRMTEAQAREAYGEAAERVPYSLEVREVPEGGEHTGAWLNKP